MSIFVRIPLKSSLEDSPLGNGVLQYCIRNSWSAALGGNEDFFKDFLKLCTILSAAPFVAG